MKRAVLILVFLLLTVWTASPGLAAKKRAVDKLKYPELNPINMPEIHKTTTGNGIRLRLIKDDKLPLVSLNIMLKGGNAYESATKIGLADITADLLRIGGTGDLSGADLDKRLDTLGITVSFRAREDYFQVSMECLVENFDEAVSLLARMLRDPVFAPEKLAEIKARYSSNVARRNDQPSAINQQQFGRLIYGQASPFGALLEYEHLESITRADVLNYHRQFFFPGNMLVGAVGPLEAEQLQKVFETHLGSWTANPPLPSFPEVKAPTHDFKVAFAQKDNLNQSYFSIGHLGIKEDLAERPKIMLFNSIFSQGISSRLNTRIRVKMGLTYGARGGIYSEYLYPGMTYFTTYTKSESTLEAIRAILEEIDTIRREPVSAEELARARDYYLNSYVFRFSTPGRILFRSLSREFYGVPDEIADRLPEDIKKVTARDIRDVARKYLHPDKMIIFVLGNEEKIKAGGAGLEELGKVKTIDISIKPPPMKEKIPAATPETLAKGKQLIADLGTKTYRTFRQLKSLEKQFDMKREMGGRTFDMSVKSVNLYPDRSRVDITVMGMKIQRTVNGRKGFMAQMGKKKPLSSEEIGADRFGDLHDVLNFPDRYTFQYLKDDTVDGKTYHVVYVTPADGSASHWVKYFINAETGLIEVRERLSRMPGQSAVEREVRSDFKTVNGIPFAYKSNFYIQGKKTMEITIKEIKVNPRVDPALFKIEE